MERIEAAMLAHRRSLAAILLLFLASWVFAAATWIDAPEESGMHPAAVAAMLLVPVITGGLVWFWRREPLRLRFDPLVIVFLIGVPVALWVLLLAAPTVLRLLVVAGTLVVVATLAGARGLGRSSLAGLVVMEANALVLFLGEGLVYLFHPDAAAGEASMSPGLMLWEGVEWGVFLGSLGLLLGWLGGLIAAIASHEKRPVGPAAPDGTSGA